MFDSTGFGLEIGPSHAPMFPKSEGFNVETLDYIDAEGLRAKYRDAGVDLSRIEEIDYVSDGALIHDVIANRHRYDFIFSSHVIEHTTDFVGYLKSCELLLKPGGIAAFAVPDKRYTFDVLQPVTTTGRVLEAHRRGQTRHSPGAVFDFFANIGRLRSADTWTRLDTGFVEFASDLNTANIMFDVAAQPDAAYHDIHGWVFTPASFRLILHDLRTLGVTTLGETGLHEAGALEFYVTLQEGGAGPGISRLDLHKALVREQVMSGLKLLGEDDPAAAQAFAQMVA